MILVKLLVVNGVLFGCSCGQNGAISDSELVPGCVGRGLSRIIG